MTHIGKKNPDLQLMSRTSLSEVLSLRQARDAIEVVDEHDQPIGYMRLDDVRRQALYHRQVMVLVYNEKNKIFLQKKEKRKKKDQPIWDVSAASPVGASQSAEETALLVLSQDLGITLQGLRNIGEAKASPGTGNAFVQVFSTGPIPMEHVHSHPVIKSGFFFDHEEITSLVEFYRELLSPALLMLWDKGLIFPPSTI